MSPLRELLEERARRRKTAEKAAAQAEADWAAKRASVDPSSLSAGELANLFDGLTADGYDRRGRKVSFVETGRPLKRRGISGGPARRISGGDY